MAITLKKKQDADAAPKAEKAPKTSKRDKPVTGKKPRGGGRAKRFSLLIGDEGAILVYMEGGKVVRRLFAPSAQPASTEAMVSLMTSNPNVPLSILVDALDQQFVRQTFPPVSPLSVNGLVKRRLDRDFQAEDIKGSLPLGRDKTGRKEWNFLLISIAKTALLTAWLDLVSELPNQLTGIFLVPVETNSYIDMLKKAMPGIVKSEWQLLVTHNKVSGFRQVVLNKGKLVFTRVTQAIDDAIPAVIAGNIEQEIINTLEYLRRLGFQDTAGLDIVVIASHDVNDALDLKRFSIANSTKLTPLDVADSLGLDQAALSADRFGDVVMTAAFVRAKKHTLRFSTAYLDSLAKLYKAKKALKAATVLIALAFIGLSGDNIMTMLDNNAAVEKAETQRHGISGKLTELKGSIAGLNKNLAFKSAAVSAYDVYFKDALVPQDFFTRLSALTTSQERVLSIDWQNTKAGSASTAGPAGTPAPAPTAGKDDAPLAIVAEFEFRGTYPDVEALERGENAFLDLITSKFPEYTITHEPFPWQKGSDKGLEISFDQKQDTALKEGDTHLKVTFTGPKKTPAAGGAPGGPPPGIGGPPPGFAGGHS